MIKRDPQIITCDYDGYPGHKGLDTRSVDDNGKPLPVIAPVTCELIGIYNEEKWGVTLEFKPALPVVDSFKLTHLLPGTWKKGQTFEKGESIGYTGVTPYMNGDNPDKKKYGMHLHTSCKVDGKPVDPKEFYRAIGVEYIYNEKKK